jgi:hypothetical protein
MAALCKTLAYISGHYKSAMAARSLLTGQERQLTMKMSPTSPNQARTLDSYLAREFLDRTIKNKGGAVFDIYEDQYDRFMDNFTHI